MITANLLLLRFASVVWRAIAAPHTRFRMPWRWDGGPATLQSRAWDDAGNVQPTRAEFVAQRGELKAVPPIGAVLNQHFNAVTSWGVDGTGEVKHVYA